jgi:outer membrane lipoprotein-sorting protein
MQEQMPGVGATAGLTRNADQMLESADPHGRTSRPWHAGRAGMSCAVLAVLAAVLLLPSGALLAAEQPAAPAQPAAAPAATASDDQPPQRLSPELKAVLDKLDEANKKLVDCTANVDYVRAIPLLEEKQKSRGSLIFKKPDKIVLKLGKPRNEDVYTDGKTWWVVEHNDKQVEVYEAAQPGQGSQETAFLDFGYGKGSDAFLKDYTVELMGKEAQPLSDDKTETLYRLKFTPKPKKGQPPPRYESIEVVISDQLWLPQVLVLHESGGEIDHTYTLSKIKLNTDIKDDVFECQPPSGYTVLHPQNF